jgi:hypothetical protein
MSRQDGAPLAGARRAGTPGERAQLAVSFAILAAGVAAGLVLLAAGPPRDAAVIALLVLAAVLSGVQGMLTD